MPFGMRELLGELLRRARPVAQQLDQLDAEGIGHRVQLRRLGDDHRLLGVVVVAVNGRHVPTIRQMPTIRKSAYGSRA